MVTVIKMVIMRTVVVNTNSSLSQPYRFIAVCLLLSLEAVLLYFGVVRIVLGDAYIFVVHHKRTELAP
jgi:hypothetical protein